MWRIGSYLWIKGRWRKKGRQGR
ncbi:hypothetical protein [Argonema antarcticum]